MLRTASQYEGVINPGLLALVTCAISCKLFAFKWILYMKGREALRLAKVCKFRILVSLSVFLRKTPLYLLHICIRESLG